MRRIAQPFPQEGAASLAVLDETALGENDLPASTKEALAALEDDAELRAFTLRWTGIEDAISERLLQMEASHRHLSVEALLQQEVTSKVAEPSEAEIMGFYTANRTRLGASFAEASPMLRVKWHEERVQALRRALVDQLREAHKIRYVMPPPSLTRKIIAAKGPHRGQASAPITLVVFSDFTCSYSVQMRRLLQALEDDYPNALYIIHQNYPLSMKGTGYALARAGGCAGAQNKFWPLYEALFDGSVHASQVELDKAIRGADLDPHLMATCMADPNSGRQVAVDIALGKALGVRATPTLFLNGMRLTGVLPRPLMRLIIDQELSEPHEANAGKGKP